MISVAVMAHPARRAWVPPLVRKLGHGAVPIWDEGWNDRHRTGLEALRAGDPDASHHLIVQDDALLPRNLVEGVTKLIEATGDHPVALYCGHMGPTAVAFRGALASLEGTYDAGFITGQGPLWGVGILIPTGHLADLCAFYETATSPNYDRRISRFYDSAGISCYYTVPSLVDHRSGPENPSLVGGRSSVSRTAVSFLGLRRSAAALRWRPEPLTTTVPAAPGRDWFIDTATGRRVGAMAGSERAARLRTDPRYVVSDLLEDGHVTYVRDDGRTRTVNVRSAEARRLRLDPAWRLQWNR